MRAEVLSASRSASLKSCLRPRGTKFALSLLLLAPRPREAKAPLLRRPGRGSSRNRDGRGICTSRASNVPLLQCEGVSFTALAQDRPKAVVFLDGGYFLYPPPAGGDQADFATRLKKPVMMVNGRFDSVFSVDTAQDPLFKMFGTPPADNATWNLTLARCHRASGRTYSKCPRVAGQISRPSRLAARPRSYSFQGFRCRTITRGTAPRAWVGVVHVLSISLRFLKEMFGACRVIDRPCGSGDFGRCPRSAESC